jgi:hypothetical protein
VRRLIAAAVLAVLLALHPVRGEPACPPPVKEPTAAELQAAQRQARNRGVLWRFEKDGRRGYLYGTLHVGNLEWAIPGNLVALALADAETIAIESDPLDPAFQSAILAAPKPGEAPALSPPLLARLRQQAAKVCATWENIATLPPTMIVTTLALLGAGHEGLYAAYATEVILAGVAKGAGKPLVALESGATQRAAVMIGSPAEQLVFIEATLAALENGTANADLLGTARAWANGDLDALTQHLARATPAERLVLDRTVLGRNAGLAARIEALHGDGRRVFAAVGIYHMVGDTGVQHLLAARGFKVQRVLFGAP